MKDVVIVCGIYAGAAVTGVFLGLWLFEWLVNLVNR